MKLTKHYSGQAAECGVMNKEQKLSISWKKFCFLALIACALPTASQSALANEYEEFRNEIESANKEYKNISCTRGKAEYSEMLTYEEICEYGQECPSEKRKQIVYCREALLSECFSKKAWLTSNNFFGLPESISVAKTSTHKRAKMKNGKLQQMFLHCAYYN